jgi:hypothetical protein
MRIRAGALLALAVAVGLILWLALRDTGSGSSTKAVSAHQIRILAASVGHPIFWVGPRKRYTYELDQKSNGSIYIRYLPPGAEVGTKTPYMTIATYPFAGAFAAIQKVSRERGSTPITLTHNGLGEVSRKFPQSVHAAYPGIDYEVEIYHPTPGKAAAIVRAGRLAAFGGLGGATAPSAAKPTAASLADLSRLAASLGHPLYWVGSRSGYTYELTNQSDGKIYIRYLPPGAKLRTKHAYLTVGTYPFRKAFEAIQGVARKKKFVKITLANGGLAVFDPSDPTHIHLAYPGSDYQVEVFDPTGRVRQIVSSGRVITIG